MSGLEFFDFQAPGDGLRTSGLTRPADNPDNQGRRTTPVAWRPKLGAWAARP